jgi:AAA family ATP:ADP antiporter
VGAEVKTYASAGQALLLLAVIPLYGAFASKVNRDRLVTFVTLFFISHLVIFYALGVRGVHVGVAFFLWIGIFNVFVIAQFWALANDLYNKEQGRRLMPILGIGSSLGAWIGSVRAESLFPVFGPYGMMIFSAGVLLLCVVVSHLVKYVPQSFAKESQTTAEEPLKKDGAFRLIFNSRYLFCIAMLILIVNVVNTTGEFILGKLVVDHADQLIAAGAASAQDKALIIGTFYAGFFGWVNLIGMLIQLFVVSRLFKYVGVRGALFVLPAIALMSYGLVAIAPLLGLVRIAKIMENSTDYSVQNTARHSLFLPTSREAKYKAKSAIDSFFWRAGDVFAALVVFIGAQLAFNIKTYALINLVLGLVWIGVVVLISREHVKLSAEGKRDAA